MKGKRSNMTVGRLIVVDDESELMSALCEMLASQGYETVGYTSGAEAVEALKEKDCDLLLTDLMMPGMDGIALLKAGLEIDPNLVGIIMTGQGTIQTAVEAIKIGAFDYVLKPFKLNALLPILSRAMEVRHLKMENIELRETVAIHELGNAIAFSFDLQSILNKATDAALQQCKADEASIMLPAVDGKHLYVAAARGDHIENFLGERTPMEEGIAGWVARNREPVTLYGEVIDSRFAPVTHRTNVHAAISMPMLAGGNLVGVLNVTSTRSRRPFTLGQVKTLNILVSIIAPILENTCLYHQIRKAEEKYHSIFENAVEGIFQTTPEGAHISANPAYARMFGYKNPEELMSSVTDIGKQFYVNPEDRIRIMDVLEKKGIVEAYEVEKRRKDNTHFWVSINARAVRDEEGKTMFLEGTLEDITERKQMEDLYETLAGSSLISVFIIQDGRLKFVNQKAVEYSGYTEAELLEKEPATFIHPDDREEVKKQAIDMLKGKQSYPYEARILTKDGQTRWFLEAVSAITYRGKPAILGNTMDITELKHTEEWLLRERSIVDRIMKTSPAGIMVVNREGRIIFANDRAGAVLGMSTEKLTRLRHEAPELGITDFEGKPIPGEQLPFEMVMAAGAPVYSIYHAVEKADGKRAYLSVNGAPLFDPSGQIDEIVFTIDDITEARRAEEKIKQSLDKLRKTFIQTAAALSSALEKRDPYTAGHQRKVARLAMAIAGEMGITNDRLEAIHVAGILHDVGKIYVSSDILNKPGKLSKIEFSLIQEHAAVGYEILKEIDFPWPIADIILQHHERLDGSGYPSGITGEEMLPAAKILSVADVVEAMASHRPYRPALGIDKALEEITQQRDLLYDSGAVNACLRLFREKGFKFEIE
jgi:PAS domain S-box-containing protein/putative nucleotidyltransferase with HDIG domain